MRPIGFPEYDDIAVAILALLVARGGADGSLRPKDTYDPLADFFRLSKEQRLRPGSDGRPGSSAWENVVQWTRQRLINQGMLDGSTRGVWSITAHGRSRALGSKALSFFQGTQP